MTKSMDHSHVALADALRASGFDTADLVDLLPVMVWMSASDGRCEFVNRRCAEYTGLPVNELLGESWPKVVHPEDSADASRAWREAIECGSDFRVQCRLRRTDGTYRWFDSRAYALRGANGAVLKYFGINIDIDEAHVARRALAVNEERLRFALLATHDSVYDFDLKTGDTYRNDTYQSEFGAPPMTRSSENWWSDRIHPDDRDRVLASSAAAFGARQPKWSEEYRLRRVDGTYANVTDRAYLLYDTQQTPARMIGAIADITARKAVEQSLRDAQARLMTALEGAQMGTWIWDIEQDRLWWDEAAYRLWDKTPSALGDMKLGSLMRFVEPQDRAGVEAVLAEFAATGTANVLEFRVQRADGQLQWMQVRPRVERDAAGKPVRMAGVYLDITERKRAEQTLRDAQGRLLSVLESGGLGTWIWDIVNDDLYWDDAAYRLWGRRPGELAPLKFAHVADLIHPDDRERVRAASEQFFRTGYEVPTEFRPLRPDGAVRWLITKGQIERDESGKPLRMAGVFLDVTDRKRSEAAQLRSQKMESLGTLAGGIAHDFNNILLAISGNAKLAIEDLQTLLPKHHPVQRNLAEIDRATARATDLVRRILAFSRQQEVKHEVVRLRPVVEDALRLLRSTMRTSIEIRTAFDECAPPAAVDAIQIHQVVMNLVTNADHAICEAGGIISIRVDAHTAKDAATNEQGKLPLGEYVRLAIEDTGTGIDTAIVERIFDPFFTTKQAGKGTGLGLAVVHGIVESHGGVIAVSNLPGGGASFRIYFPAATNPPANGDVAALVTLERGKGERILYVDDEEPLVFLITNVLERLGYRVTGCIDPLQAVEQFRAAPNDFDAVVTDLSMYGMNGFELTRRLHALRPDIPVLLTSGYLRTEDRETAQRCGIRELILKPNTVEELGHAIVRALAQAKSEPS